MKTSIVLVVLLFLNTTALILDPILNSVNGISSWWFISFEIVLAIAYYINRIIKGLNILSEVSLNNLNIFVTKDSNKK